MESRDRVKHPPYIRIRVSNPSFFSIIYGGNEEWPFNSDLTVYASSLTKWPWEVCHLNNYYFIFGSDHVYVIFVLLIPYLPVICTYFFLYYPGFRRRRVSFVSISVATQELLLVKNRL